MKLEDSLLISAPQAQVWDALNDPQILQQCIEGCTRLERREDGAFDGTVQAKVGPVRASFQGVVTISEADPPHKYILTGEGKGGVAGFAKGKASVSLESVGASQTQLKYSVDAAVGGKLAQLGARLIESTAREYSEKFFARFREVVEAPSAPIIDTAGNSESLPTISESPSRPRAGMSAWIWSGLVIAVLAAMAWIAVRAA